MHLHTRLTRHVSARAVAVVAAVVTVVALSACNPVVVTPGTPPGTIDVTFSINTAQGVKAISPLIYGINSTTNLAANRPGMVRQGGNRWTAYNWETNASNAGSDWQFQNDNFLSSSTVPGAAVKPTI